MNRIVFDQTGGFPLETDVWEFMQQAYEQFNVVGELAGNYSILQGCQLQGNTVSDGVVYIDGEVLPFRGGPAGSSVIIKEERIQREFEDGVDRDVYIIRYATFGSGNNAIPWSDFRRVYPLTSAIIKDEIRMFAGDPSHLPPGWYLCDGQNGTVDLRSKFIVGFNPNDPDYDQIGKTGGAKEVALTEAQMPRHKHNATTGSAGYHHHSYGYYPLGTKGKLKRDDAYYRVNGTRTYTNTSGAGAHTHPVTVDFTGNNEAQENRPPYYVLAYIQFKGI